MKQFRKVVLVISACLGMTLGAEAQITCSRASIPGKFSIQSTGDYTKAQDSVQVLAYALYTMYSEYPDFTYVHHVDEQGKIAAISVMGIRDTELAVAAANYLMSIEILGEALNTMDKSLIPAQTSATREKKLGREDTLKYKPSPRLPKDKRSPELTPATTLTASRTAL